MKRLLLVLSIITAIVPAGMSAHDVFIQSIVGEITCHHKGDCIAQANEKAELLILDEHVAKNNALLRLTQHYVPGMLGRYGVKQVLDYPTNDVEELARRQDLVRQLVENDELYEQVKKELELIAKNEYALLSYWNPQDPLKAGAEGLYFRKVLGLNTMLNKSKLALEAASPVDMGKAALGAVSALGMYGVVEEIVNLFLEGKKPNFMRGIRNGFMATVRKASPFANLYSEDKMNPRNPFDPNQRIHGDSPKHALHKFELDKMAVLGKDKELDEDGKVIIDPTTGKPKIANEDETPVVNRYNGMLGAEATLRDTSIAASSAVFDILKFVMPDFLGFGDMKDKRTQALAGVAKILGVAMAGGVAYKFYTELWESLKGSYGTIKSTYQTTGSLRDRLTGVRTCVHSMRRLAQTLGRDTYFGKSCSVQHIREVMSSEAGTEIKKMAHLLNSDTFNGKSTPFYRRGRVLYLHKKLGEKRAIFSPFLKMVAEVGAYFAAATMVREARKTEGKFSFVEFIPGDKPVIDIDHGWMPWLGIVNKTVVHNNMSIGDSLPGKVIISGPNWCGKSIFLKMVGQSVYLAHTFGIAPAEYARMTVFDSLMTSFSPSENVEAGWSTFFAQQASMESKQEEMKALGENKKILFLGDEIYSGTNASKTERLIEEFAQFIGPKKNIAAFVATHVAKPTQLARTQNSIFANYQVEILGNNEQTFERTFKIIPGAADWWFKDDAQSEEFIRWIRAKYHTSKAPAAPEAAKAG